MNFTEFSQNSYSEFSVCKVTYLCLSGLVPGALLSPFGDVLFFWMVLMLADGFWCQGIEELGIYCSLHSLGLFVIQKLPDVLLLFPKDNHYSRFINYFVLTLLLFKETESCSVSRAGVQECRGTIIAHCILQLLGSTNPI